jgi:hypothetical protein
VPLPMPRPRKASQELVDEEIVREVKDTKVYRTRQRGKQLRGTW